LNILEAKIFSLLLYEETEWKANRIPYRGSVLFLSWCTISPAHCTQPIHQLLKKEVV